MNISIRESEIASISNLMVLHLQMTNALLLMMEGMLTQFWEVKYRQIQHQDQRLFHREAQILLSLQVTFRKDGSLHA